MKNLRFFFQKISAGLFLFFLSFAFPAIKLYKIH